MTSIDQQSALITEFGTLVETADGSWTIRHGVHGQDFHSSEGAKFEAWQLYIIASGLIEKLVEGGSAHPVSVLDVGMGLGYNACATIAAWIEATDSCDLVLVSLEIESRLIEALVAGNAPWTRGWDQTWLNGPAQLRKITDDRWMAILKHPKSGRTLHWYIMIGDASQLELKILRNDFVPAGFNFIWQDPFTPELNPAMWSSDWFGKVLEVSASDARLMTYSVSRAVKDALLAGGWHQERFRTPGKKRHWLRAVPLKT